MLEHVLQTLQLVSLLIGITIGLLTISKHFRESNFLKNILYLLAIVVPTIFLKKIIGLIGTNFYTLLKMEIWFGILFLVFALFQIIWGRGLDIKELFKTSGCVSSSLLVLSPIIALILNKLLGYNNWFNVNSVVGTGNYLQAIETQKINLTSYAFMNENLLLTLFFLGKGIELIFLVLIQIKGLSFLLLIRDDKFVSIPYFKYVPSDLQLITKEILLTLCFFIVFSCNLFVVILEIVFSWF